MTSSVLKDSTGSATGAVPERDAPKKTVNICAVVVTYNRKELLKRCLDGVLNQSYPVSHILIVDNASTDGTPEMLAEEYPGLELLALSENTGGAGGFHAGFKRAAQIDCNLIWVMDDDALPSEGACKALADFYDGKNALVNPSLPYEKKGEVAATEPVEEEFGIFVGMALPRTLVEKIGYPHAHYFIYHDDLEYSFRIHKAGAKILRLPYGHIYHADMKKVPREDVNILGRKVSVPEQPSWKLYYDYRNLVFRRAEHEGYIGAKFKAVKVIALGALLKIFGKEKHQEKAAMISKAGVDALLGRSGRRVTP